MLLLALMAGIAGCSRKKNTFLNRNWHALTAEYNTLYNGNLALQMGKEELSQTYADNYWNILPVERMELSEDVMLPGYNTNPNFERAEEKAVKAIQRHSMLIEGREQNPQIDEAYLLLGKARYFDQRFVPALEAFNYVLHRYPLSNSITEARIWREKANLRLEFHEIAIKNLKEILEQESLKDQHKADASAMLAQAFIDLQQEDSAVAFIDTAATFTNSNEEKGRYLFIKGQLYNALGKKDSANLAFEEVIDLNRRTPRIYHVNAHLAKLNNQDVTGENGVAVLEQLNEMAEDRENRPYLDRIYFQLGEFHSSHDSTDLAVDYYNRSLRELSEDAVLQSLNYETLGNIYFDAANYKAAGAYYDSTLTRLQQNSREYRFVKKKRDNLQDVIFYENIAATNDSILHLVNLSEEERLEYFTQHTEKLKEVAREGMTEALQQQTGRIGTFDDRRQTIPGVPDPANAFYFYNPTIVAYGKEEFIRLWGYRQLGDNWRYGNRGTGQTAAEELAMNEEVLFANNPIYDPETYISQIPSDPVLLDSLAADRNFAYYQLGLIYGEKFGEAGLAIEHLEAMLASNPEERLVLPAKYQLYKLYKQIGDSVRAESIRNDILYQYPDSRYASIIRNPGAALRNENSPEAMYAEVYELFESQRYEEVIHRSNEMVEAFAGEGIVPKFELLKAMATGRLMGLEAYKEALNYVALNYPQSEEGKKAQQLYTQALPQLAGQQFNDSTYTSLKLVFPLRRAEVAEVQELRESILKMLEGEAYSDLEFSEDIFDPQLEFLVIHGLRSELQARQVADAIQVEQDEELDYFYISSENYGVLQIQKNLDTYLNTINQSPQ